MPLSFLQGCDDSYGFAVPSYLGSAEISRISRSAPPPFVGFRIARDARRSANTAETKHLTMAATTCAAAATAATCSKSLGREQVTFLLGAIRCASLWGSVPTNNNFISQNSRSGLWVHNLKVVIIESLSLKGSVNTYSGICRQRRERNPPSYLEREKRNQSRIAATVRSLCDACCVWLRRL